MSDGRRICVCGKERGKGPVVITITTCKHNTAPTIEGGNVCMSPPLATSSPIDLQDDSKSASQKKNTNSVSTNGIKESSDAKPISNERPIETIGSSHPEGSLGKTSVNIEGSLKSSLKIDDTAYKTSLDETAFESALNETALESAQNETSFESALNETAFETAVDETAFETAVDETAFESALNETTFGSALDETIQDITADNTTGNDTTGSSAQNETQATGNETTISENTGNETTGVTDASAASANETMNESEYHTAEESGEMTEDAATDDTGAPMVIMMAETAVNTLPFLDNLFWPKYSTKPMSTYSDDQEKCTIELLMFERHTKNCKQSLKSIRRENLFFDGTTFLQSIGRLSYPTCFDVQKKESGGLNTEHSCKPDSEKNLDHCKKIFRSFEKDIQKEQFYDNNKSFTQFDIIQHRDTNDRAVQFESIYIRAPKWYDGFLICFGLKTNEEMYYTGDDDNLLSDNSSNLVTRYLRI